MTTTRTASRPGGATRDPAARRSGPRSTPNPAHPRIRARRVEVARDLGRRRRRRLNVVLALICAGVWTLVGLRSSLLDVDRIQVSGAEATDADAITAALGIGVGQPMVGLDGEAAARRVEALPFVDDARVSRLWPGTVRVQLTERTPVAVVAHPEGWALLDAEARVLAVTARAPDGLVVVDGRRDAAPGARLGTGDRELLATVAQLPSRLRDDVRGAWVGADGVGLEMSDGPCLVLGDGSDLADKVVAADAVRLRLLEVDDARLDLRVPSAPALTRGATCA